MKAKATALWLLVTSVLVGALDWHFSTISPSHNSAVQDSSGASTTSPTVADREPASVAPRSGTNPRLPDRLPADAPNEANLIYDDALDENRIDQLLENAGAFTAMIHAMHAAASTDREVLESTALFSSHLQSGLVEEGHARTVLDFSCGRQLCLAQLSDPARAPLDIRRLMQHDGAIYFQAAIVSDQVKTLDGKPSIRAVFAIDPAISQIVSIPD
ncbi:MULTISPECIES: hypothetical protein [unclassified Stenotrophomonas]|uniref:hypothetical protein n=1 Tax=unclassified Stenotrophomonas TaxID=196198 RepID=UPI0011B1F36A|nr:MULTISPECIES: hypothetical protein [unclassified Stenotrophomonas]